MQTNAFGNLLVEDTSGRIWRICPEELSCTIVAATFQEFQALRTSRSFGEDWAMGRLVDLATSLFGTPESGRCFCLKIPATLGGGYERHNLATISLSELIAASGHIARQIGRLRGSKLSASLCCRIVLLCFS